MRAIHRIFLTVYVWSPIGGVEQNITALACALRRAGYDVVVLAWAYTGDQPTMYEARLREAGIRFISTNTFLGRLAFRWNVKVEVIDRLLRSLGWLYAPLVLAYALWRRCDWQPASRGVQGRLRAIGLKTLQGFTADRYMSAWLSWLNWLRPASVLNQHLSGTPAAIQWGHRHRVPVVYSEGSLPDEHNIGHWAGIQPVLRHAQVVVAASPAIKQAIATHLGIDVSRIVIIPNTVEFGSRRAVPTPIQAPRAGPEILFVGRLDPVKGVDVLLEAAALLKERVPGWRLSIVGDGQSWGDLHRQAQALDLGDQVKFWGGIDHSSLSTHFESAWVLVAPSRHLEGFGMVLAEALSFGLPVVASDLPAFRSLVESGRNGLLVPAGDPPALADALARLIQDPAERERMRQAALASAADSPFHPDAVAKQYLDVYDQAVQPAI